MIIFDLRPTKSGALTSGHKHFRSHQGSNMWCSRKNTGLGDQFVSHSAWHIVGA